MPLISVIMSVHNDSKTIEVAINSILNQTISDFEFIICDDFSSDNTLELLYKKCQSDQRIKVIHNEKNLGLAASLNCCIKISSGKYLARMDGDDYSYSTRFEKELKFINTHEEYSFVGSNAYSYNGICFTGLILRPEVPQIKDFLRGSPYIHPTVLFRREAIEAVGGYSEKNETKLRAQDYELFMRMASKGLYGYNIQEALLRYYITPKEIKKKRTLRSFFDEVKIRWKGFRSLKINVIDYIYIILPIIIMLKQKLKKL